VNTRVRGGGTVGGRVRVSWDAPAGTCRADHYKVVNIHSDGSRGGVAATVRDTGASSYADTVSHLKLCTFYRYGVIAVDTDGDQSAVGLPHSAAFTYGTPKPNPPTVTILIQGIGSGLPRESWNPLAVSNCSSTSGNNSQIRTGTARGSLAYHWLNLGDAGHPDYAGPGAGNNLIDSAASRGGIVIPFSYTFSEMTRPSRSPGYTVFHYSATNVGYTSPLASVTPDVATTLAKLVNSIEKVFPHAKIVIIGHSNGGLVAQQWWAHFTSSRRGPQHHVVQVFSLDSPINGVYEANLCLHHPTACGALSFLGVVGPPTLQAYANLWNHQARHDPAWAALDRANKMWTAFWTNNDPLYDAGDYPKIAGLGHRDTHIGFASQLLVDPRCHTLDWQVQDGCAPIGRHNVNGFVFDDGTPNEFGPFLFGAPSDLWVHSVVKDNSRVIAAVMQYVR
jgi:pimeloyl-ACP methyl ester carboxylesterase